MSKTLEKEEKEEYEEISSSGAIVASTVIVSLAFILASHVIGNKIAMSNCFQSVSNIENSGSDVQIVYRPSRSGGKCTIKQTP